MRNDRFLSYHKSVGPSTWNRNRCSYAVLPNLPAGWITAQNKAKGKPRFAAAGQSRLSPGTFISALVQSSYEEDGYIQATIRTDDEA